MTPQGKAGARQTAACDDRFLPGLKELAGAVHDAQGKVVLQLSHAGCFAPATTGLDVVGPSDNTSGLQDCRELTTGEIRQVVAAFGQCAARAKTPASTEFRFKPRMATF